jgi:hypothetical protein
MNDQAAKSYGLSHFSLFFLLLVVFGIGCGGKSQVVDCTPLDLGVSPQTATADHAAAAPGNQVSFIGFDGLRPGCPPTPGPIRTDLKWSVSDTVNTKIGNTLNVDYGVATCINATPSPVTGDCNRNKWSGHGGFDQRQCHLDVQVAQAPTCVCALPRWNL